LRKQAGGLLQSTAAALAALAMALPLFARKMRDGKSVRISPGRIMRRVQQSWSRLMSVLDGTKVVSVNASVCSRLVAVHAPHLHLHNGESLKVEDEPMTYVWYNQTNVATGIYEIHFLYM
jgi:hypothetical protein